MKVKSVYFVGIKGVGMTPLAIIAKEAGINVRGSDTADIFITDEALQKAGITVEVGFSADHIQNPQLVITTGAHGGYENPEVKAAKKKGIRVISQGEAVGLFMEGSIFGRKFEGISIAGTHGKTTTAAILATLLKSAKLDPSFVIGTSSISSLGLPGYLGKGRYFVAEADEYATEPVHDKTPKFLWQYPKIGVITNIEHDHTDIYPVFDDLLMAFAKFTTNIPEGGLLIALGDDVNVKKIVTKSQKRAVFYGSSSTNDLILKRVSHSGIKTFFAVESKGILLGEFSINISGIHNVYNAMACIGVALELGIPIDIIKNALLAFTGSKRRFEFLGTLPSGASVYDDYAHHPTAIKKTLHAFTQSFPNSKIICVFQPHTFSRTKSFFTDFTHAFSDTDTIILSDIYPSLREASDLNVSSKHLVTAISEFHKKVLYMPTRDNVVEYIAKQGYNESVIIILMGAGDVYKIAENLVLKK